MRVPADDPATLVATLDRSAIHQVTGGAGRRMVWRSWGSGPPLALVHGANGSWTHWIRNIPTLATCFTVLAGDMLGFGDSDDAPEPHTAEALAAAVASGLAELAPSEPISVAAFSLGTIVAGLVAAEMSGLAALLLIGPGGLALPSGAASLTLQRLNPGATEAEAREVHRANLRTLMLADPTAVDDLAVYVQMQNVRRTRFRSGQIPTSGALLAALPRIRAPLTVFYGQHDAFATPDLEARRAIFTGLGRATQFHVVPGAGHWAIYEAADVMNRALLRALTSAPPPDCRDSS